MYSGWEFFKGLLYCRQRRTQQQKRKKREFRRCTTDVRFLTSKKSTLRPDIKKKVKQVSFRFLRGVHYTDSVLCPLQPGHALRRYHKHAQRWACVTCYVRMIARSFCTRTPQPSGSSLKMPSRTFRRDKLLSIRGTGRSNLCSLLVRFQGVCDFMNPLSYNTPSRVL